MPGTWLKHVARRKAKALSLARSYVREPTSTPGPPLTRPYLPASNACSVGSASSIWGVINIPFGPQMTMCTFSHVVNISNLFSGLSNQWSSHVSRTLTLISVS